MSNNPNQEQEQSDAEEIELGVRLNPASLRNYISEVAAEIRRSDEDIRNFIREYVDEHVQPVDEDAIVDRVVERVGTGGGGGGGEFDGELAERLRFQADRLDFPERRVGPPEPSGGYHAVPMWGVRLKTGYKCYIRSAVIDAEESGSFTAAVGEYDGETFNEVDSTEIQVDDAGEQRVTLDLNVPGPGEYLLTRPGDFTMRRGEWGGWQETLEDNLRLISGAKPDEYGGPDVDTSDNQNWYYFHDCEITASPDHEIKE